MSVEATSNVTGTYAVQGSSAATPVSAPVEPVEKAEKPKQEEFSIADRGGNVKGDKEDKSSGQASKEALKEAVDKINKSVSNTSAIFGIHDKTNRITIKIVDKDTKDVVKEIPAEETLDLVAKAWEMAGILVDEKR